MAQAEARSWWADVEHLREAAERRQAAETGRRAAERARRGVAESGAEVRARARAAERVRDAGDGQVDELSARRAVASEERAPRARRPVPIWLADDAPSRAAGGTDRVVAARARASAPRRTIEIRGQMVATVVPRPPLGLPADIERARPGVSLGSFIGSHPDRLAFWAFALALVLAVAALTSS